MSHTAVSLETDDQIRVRIRPGSRYAYATLGQLTVGFNLGQITELRDQIQAALDEATARDTQ